MDCDSLHQNISLWIRHLSLAVTTILPAEKHLCTTVFSFITNSSVRQNCFAAISTRIMLLLFRFGEKFAVSPNNPRKLLNLLKMSDALRRLRPYLSALFDNCAPKISARFNDLDKFLISSTFGAFSTLQTEFKRPADVSVPSIVLQIVNFLTCVAADRYAPSPPHAFTNALDALQRIVEAVWEKFRDRIAAHVFAMNTNWHIYVKTRGTELARLVGEEEMIRRYKGVAEAAAYAYQDEAWGPMAGMLERADVGGFRICVKENLRRHRRGCRIQDGDLREQIRGEVEKMLVSAYGGFLSARSGAVEGSGFVLMEDVRAMLGWIFDDGGGRERRTEGRERTKGRRRRRIARLQFDDEVERRLSLCANDQKFVSDVENSCSFSNETKIRED